jgi:D-alanyl-lipoteichoic acid acyltransferase DltB (MBOAT superfamily)
MVSFFAFVSFFPQLVAGPIERAKNLLPQFERTRTFNNEKAKDGLRQILNGLIKKVVIADVLAIEVDRIFSAPSFEGIPAMTLLLGAIYFAFQIYCDFSGYSDIAIGTARLFGFDLMQNFNFPFFSKNWGEFWNRWHISLSTWFRNYLYITLGGSYGPKWQHARNILITFIVSGLWHGANWTFIVWGALCGILYLPMLFRKKPDKNMVGTTHSHLLSGLWELLQMASIFAMFALVMIIFRSASLELAWDYFIHLFRNIGRDTTSSFALLKIKPLALILLLLVAEWLQRSKQHALQIDRLSTTVRWSIYVAALVLFLYFGEFNSDVQFIYFQF